LRQVGYPNYEIVIYTKENGMTVHPIVDGLDPEQKIMYRLYRDATNFKGNKHRKVRF
jgi:import inner membrane translocase subunit TIM50